MRAMGKMNIRKKKKPTRMMGLKKRKMSWICLLLGHLNSLLIKISS
jgi:hypothetical protein